MISPICLYQKLLLLNIEAISEVKYPFVLFKINEGNRYDFTDNLGFEENQDGVYVFIQSIQHFRFNNTETKCYPEYEMLYCGRTDNLRERFNDHHHKKELRTIDNLYIAVCFCKNEEETNTLEKLMLSTYHFKFNAPETNRGELSEVVIAVSL